jgi:pentatricopeptide repeat protein
MVIKLLNISNRCAKKTEPDDLTFVFVLSACSHAGLVDEGMQCYGSMSEIYRIPAQLEHYACMVDLLGHAGHLQEAENMIKEMPCKPDVVV